MLVFSTFIKKKHLPEVRRVNFGVSFEPVARCVGVLHFAFEHLDATVFAVQTLWNTCERISVLDNFGSSNGLGLNLNTAKNVFKKCF